MLTAPGLRAGMRIVMAPFAPRSTTKPEKAAASASGVAEPTPEYMQSFEVIGTPEDLDGARDLALRDKYQFQWWACSLVNAQPYQGKKKGADGGIDGLIFFQDDKGAAKKIVVSVKGGDNVSVAMVRDLAHVVKREKAEIGLFVTLADPSKPMTIEAIKEGFYKSPDIGEFPRIQILTIAGLLNGTERARASPTCHRADTRLRKPGSIKAKAIRRSCFSILLRAFPHPPLRGTFSRREKEMRRLKILLPSGEGSAEV